MKKWLKIGGIIGAAIVGVAALGIAAYSLLPTPVSAKVAPARMIQRAVGMERFGRFEGEFDRMGEFDRRGGPGRFGGQIDFDALLADALGITVEELQVAYEQANAAAVQQALAEGLITQEQADMMLAQRQLKNYIDQDALTAKALGITVEELQAARDEDKPLVVLAYELGLDQATMRTNMQNAYQEAIQQAVTDGVITQDQADQILDRPGFGFGGFHGRGGFGGPRGFGGFGGK